MVFRLYAAPTDGSALFTEPQTVAVNDGEFNVVLGSSAALNLPFDVPYFLGVSVDADPEMTPRRAVTASAYAFRAGVADALAPSATVARGQITGSIAGSQIAGSITSATLPAGNLTGSIAGSQIAGSITSTTLPAANITGTIGTAQIANNAVTQAKLSPTTGAAAGKVLGTDGTNLVWQAAASGGGVTSVGASSPLASSGGSTPNISLTGTVPVANGGTGAAALASNGILLGQGTNPVTTIAAGTPGQVLTATAGAPTWTSSPSPTGNLTLNQSTSASVGNIFKGSVPFIHNFPDAGNNTFIGGDAGNFTTTGTGNVGAGTVTLRANTTGSNNVAVGSFTLDLNTTGTANTALGTLALDVNVGGSNNTAVGMSALSNFTSGVGNIAIGKSAGVNLTTGSNNIDIGNSGVAGESNTIRIGDPGAHTKTILAGNVGIGTPTPDAKLRVDLTAGAPGPVAWISGPESQLVLQGVGGAGAMAILDFQTYPTVGGALRQTGSIRSIDTGAFGGHMAFFTKASGAETNPFSERMRITDDGNVGVGTSTPTKARLQISGVGPGTSLGAGFLLQSTGTGAYAAVPNIAMSVHAEGIVAGIQFLAFSDERIKRVEGRSNPARDLATLKGIEVTDYSYVDTMTKGTGKYKKVIAQQVEKVYPQAVKRSTDVVPDIYQKADVKDGWVKLATNLKKGERVRLIGRNKEGVHEVLDVAPGRFRTDFAADGDAVFVYGREVKDFRTVDYEAIAMLNVSATQELHRWLEKQAAALAAQTAVIESQAARIDAFEKQATEMAMLKQQMAELQAAALAMGRQDASRLAAAK